MRPVSMYHAVKVHNDVALSLGSILWLQAPASSTYQYIVSDDIDTSTTCTTTDLSPQHPRTTGATYNG